MFLRKLANVLNPAYKKVPVDKAEMDVFISSLNKYLKALETDESEEHYKTPLRDLLNEVYYKDEFAINTKGRADFVIFNGKTDQTSAGVLVETKKPNSSDMVTEKSLDNRSMHELMLYYMRERVDHENNELKHLIITDFYQWYVFDAVDFYNLIYQNTAFRKKYKEWNTGQTDSEKTNSFYKDIASPFIKEIQEELPFTHFDIREYLKASERKQVNLYKFLSPEHLLKKPFANDSNRLNRAFYNELLHLIGLEEEGKSKKVINRKAEDKRNEGSLIENAIHAIERDVNLTRVENLNHYGSTNKEQRYQIALELCITWVNRILFLKLLEAQLVNYHDGDAEYKFLSSERIPDWDELNKLFFDVLAVQTHLRHSSVKEAYSKVPYLNSSLFERTELEEQTILISNLDNTSLPLRPGSVLGKEKDAPKTLTYLFRFLDAYDFSSEGKEQVIREKKSLINASVLGLIFEKINGYKDGSFFTPGFITMYMCRETLRRAVVQKFNEEKGWKCETLDDLYDKIEDRKEANDIINSLRVIDPAVGSGHFLVSALNELIVIKHELKILQDRDGKRLKEYQITIENDELHIQDDDGDLFEYTPGNAESQRVQETLFHEKQTLIENCLFGVDINPNSVKICRLRLWIELLKHAYYTQNTKGHPEHVEGEPVGDPRNTLREPQGDSHTPQLETLPNIDINIKTGNSLISRFGLDEDLSKALRSIKYSIDDYRGFVQSYKNETNKEVKRGLQKIIDGIKGDIRTEIAKYTDPDRKRLFKLSEELYIKYGSEQFFDTKLTKKQKADRDKLESQINGLKEKIDKKINDPIYQNAFEWRFEFPEVLDDQGNYVGFDVCIGNPPYISVTKLKDQSSHFGKAGYETYMKGTDVYALFYERGINILKTKGLVTFITSNSWMRAIYGGLLKTFFKKKAQPCWLLNIEDIQVFEEATVESNIIGLSKTETTQNFPVCNLSSDYTLGAPLDSYFQANSFEFTMPEGNEWVVSDEVSFNLKDKIDSIGNRLGTLEFEINRGLLTGYNAAFIIDKKKKDELIKADPKSEEIIQPIIRGRDIQKYEINFQEQWAICTFPSLKLKIEDYPAIKDHFEKIGKKRLEQSGEVGSRKRTSHAWFETQDSIAYWKDFQKPKIVWGEISDHPKFSFDDGQYYVEATSFLMTGSNLEFTLAILNSKVSEWYFNQISTTTGMGTNRWKKYKIEQLPIATPSETQRKEIETLVTHILEAKKKNRKADTSKEEAKIDQLVYQLYGLSEEEIDIIENSLK